MLLVLLLLLFYCPWGVHGPGLKTIKYFYNNNNNNNYYYYYYYYCYLLYRIFTALNNVFVL